MHVARGSTCGAVEVERAGFAISCYYTGGEKTYGSIAVILLCVTSGEGLNP